MTSIVCPPHRSETRRVEIRRIQIHRREPRRVERAARLLALSTVLLAVAGCGDDDSSSGPNTSVDASTQDANLPIDATLPDSSQPPDASTSPDASTDASQPPADASCTIDCPELPEGCYYDGQDCEANRCGEAICPNPDTPCGSLFNPVCGGNEYCDYTDPGACGLLDETGFCRARPTSCGDECDEVCSCDGTTYCNECQALLAGRDVAHEGPCAAPDPCRPMDAFGIGDCTDTVGYAWNGTTCEPIVGCSCDGTDCFRVESTEELCLVPFQSCGSES